MILFFQNFHVKVPEASEDDDIFSCQAKISNIMTKWKVNANAIFNELRVTRFCVHFSHIVSMSVVHPALKTDNLQLEGEIFNGYRARWRSCILFVCNQ